MPRMSCRSAPRLSVVLTNDRAGRPAGSAVGTWMLLVVLVLVLAAAGPTLAATPYDLQRFLDAVDPGELFPGAISIGAIEGDPPVAPMLGEDGLLGYLFLNSDFVNTTGYSGKPIHVLVAIDRAAVIRGARLVEHHEPIVLVGIPEHKISAVIDHYVGLDVAALANDTESQRAIDAVSGATVTVMVIDDSIVRAALKVARAYGLGGLKARRVGPSGPVFTVDDTIQGVEDWIALVSDGSVRRLKLTVDTINQSFEALGDAKATARPESGDPGEAYIELYAGLVSVPTIGQSLLGAGEYRNLQKRLEAGGQAVLLAADGRYSFKGSGYVRGGIFDRFVLRQGDLTVRFHDRDHKRLRKVAAEGAPKFDEVDLFVIPADLGFDPALPWRVELLVGRATGATQKAFVTFKLDYQVPKRFLKASASIQPATQQEAGTAEDDEGPPLWQKLWYQKADLVAVLGIALTLLTVIFFFQNTLTRHRRATEWVRVGFLIFTLFGIGFYANAQLSVVNILTVFSAVAGGFNWEYFLMEPLIFLLWGSVAASLLFWGRGVYCGWLCPFGALQELLSRIAKALRIPQITLPWGLHERLWTVKYIIFLVLFGVSLHSLAIAERMAEVEPFKTAIILKFMREWPFVLFAVAVLAVGLFVERFYCRYVCPLGAALAIPARLRMFEWLKRYKQCGSPCQICANGCMVQAIHPEGNINPNECLYCLHCQQLYYDDHACPVMIQKRQKRERASARSSKASPQQVEELLTVIRDSRERK